MTAVRRFSRSSATIALLYATSTGLGFLIGLVLARLLGAAGYGTYALGMAGATLAGMVLEFGLPVLAMRDASAAKDERDWGELRGLLHWGDRLFLGLSAILLTGFFASYFADAGQGQAEIRSILFWSIILIPLVAIGKVRAFLLLGLGLSFASQFPNMVLRPLLFLIGCGLVWFASGGLDPSSALAAQVASAGAVMLIAMVWLRLRGPAQLWSAAPRREAKRWIAHGLPMGLSESLRFLQPQLALLLIGILSTSVQAGLYRVADAIALVTATVTSIVGTAGAPLFGRLWAEDDHDGLGRVAIISAWAMTIGTTLLGLPVALAGGRLFELLFGTEFAAAYAVFLILWGGAMLVGTLGQTIWLANMTGQHLLATRAFVIIAVVNLLCGLLLIPAYGAMGGAIGTVIGTLLGTGWCALAYHRRTGLNPTLFQAGAFRIGREALRSGLERLGGSGRA